MPARSWLKSKCPTAKTATSLRNQKGFSQRKTSDSPKLRSTAAIIWIPIGFSKLGRRSASWEQERPRSNMAPLSNVIVLN